MNSDEELDLAIQLSMKEKPIRRTPSRPVGTNKPTPPRLIVTRPTIREKSSTRVPSPTRVPTRVPSRVPSPSRVSSSTYSEAEVSLAIQASLETSSENRIVANRRKMADIAKEIADSYQRLFIATQEYMEGDSEENNDSLLIINQNLEMQLARIEDIRNTMNRYLSRNKSPEKSITSSVIVVFYLPNGDEDHRVMNIDDPLDVVVDELSRKVKDRLVIDRSDKGLYSTNNGKVKDITPEGMGSSRVWLRSRFSKMKSVF